MKLENIEKSAVRNEFKLWIYDLKKTYQTKLDALCTKYVRKKLDRTPYLCNQLNSTDENRP